MTTYRKILTPRWLQLAIAQDDRTEIRRLIDTIQPAWFGAPFGDLRSVMFDGPAILDDRERIEADAPEWMNTDTFTAPFATRALATARRDPTLLGEAAAKFEAMGLGRRAEETRSRAAEMQAPHREPDTGSSATEIRVQPVPIRQLDRYFLLTGVSGTVMA